MASARPWAHILCGMSIRRFFATLIPPILALAAVEAAAAQTTLTLSRAKGSGSDWRRLGLPQRRLLARVAPATGRDRSPGSRSWVALSPEVLLGVESNAWIKSLDVANGLDAKLTLAAVSGTVTVYPMSTTAFFLKGGVGLSFMSTRAGLSGLSAHASKAGWGVIGGLGYDLRVGRKTSITPSFNYYYGKPGDISVGGDVVFPGWNHSVLDFALGITFH